jgi:hypothetical protein
VIQDFSLNKLRHGVTSLSMVKECARFMRELTKDMLDFLSQGMSDMEVMDVRKRDSPNLFGTRAPERRAWRIAVAVALGGQGFASC